MAGRFPELERREALSALEWDALRSINVACAELRQEFDAARTRAGGMLLKHDVAEEYAGPDPLQRSHCAALGEVATLAVRYEDHVGALTWRYASASFVLGVAVMDRLLRGDAPLPREEIVRLCREPSLGQLQEAADGPYARLVAFRDDEQGWTPKSGMSCSTCWRVRAAR